MVAIVFIIIIVNFYMWFRRSRGAFKRTKKTVSEAQAAKLRHEKLLREFENEMEEAEKYLERRRKTWALYEQVRSQAAAVTDCTEAKSEE